MKNIKLFVTFVASLFFLFSCEKEKVETCGSVILYQISEIGGSAYTHHAIGISLFGFCRAWRYCNQPFSQEYAPVFG